MRNNLEGEPQTPTPPTETHDPKDWSSGEKQEFFGEHYFSSENYGVPKGYKAYDTEGFWKSATDSMKKYQEGLPGDKYLDLGCAFGHLMKLAPFKEVYGADISAIALKTANSELAEAGLPYRQVAQLDADDNLPFASETFGCVTALDIIEHTKSRAHTLQEINRVMLSGGLLIAGMPITDTWEARVWGKYLDKDKSHISKPTRAELFADLENTGFEVKEFRYYFPIPQAKLRFPRTNIEVVAIKTDKTPAELRAMHQERFPKADFLEQKETVETIT